MGSWVCGVPAAGLADDAGIASVALAHALISAGEDAGDDGLEDDAGGSRLCSDRRRKAALLLRVSERFRRLGERPRMSYEPLRLSRRPLLPLRRRGLAGGVDRASCRLRLGDLTRCGRWCRCGERDLLRA